MTLRTLNQHSGRCLLLQINWISWQLIFLADRLKTKKKLATAFWFGRKDSWSKRQFVQKTVGRKDSWTKRQLAEKTVGQKTIGRKDSWSKRQLVENLTS